MAKPSTRSRPKIRAAINPPPNSADLIQRERRLMAPAGYAALLGVILFVASVFIQAGVGGAADTDFELLEQYNEHGSTLLLGDIVGGLGFLCFTFPLYILFRGAQARADRVRGALVAFAFIGPVLLAIQGPVQSIALKDAGEKFVQEAPAAEPQPSANEDAQQAKPADAKAAGTTEDQGGKTESGSAAAKGGEVTTTPTTEGSSTTTTTSDEGGDGESAEEKRAGDLIDDSGSVQFARALIFPALLGLVFGMVYISMWAMRVGLITRFWGTLGMALGVSLILLPFAQLLLVIWFLAIGILLLGRWPGGRPPAWDAGVAIPWTKPGEEAERAAPDTLEGQGREIPPEQAGVPDGGIDAPGDTNGDDPNAGGPPPRKRKRRS